MFQLSLQCSLKTTMNITRRLFFCLVKVLRKQHFNNIYASICGCSSKRLLLIWVTKLLTQLFVRRSWKPVETQTIWQAINPLALEFSFKFWHILYLKREYYRNQKRWHYEINGILKKKKGECAACLKYSVSIFVE